jgi:TM2 domain-containing membrane protein YozV
MVIMDLNTHSTTLGYVLWIVGFTGSHRFYYGRPISGTLWFLTGGLFFVGWIIDFFLIPGMDREADIRFKGGKYSYTITWVLLTFGGIFGVHRFYLGKWISGLVWLLTFGLLGCGYLYDLWTLNKTVSEANSSALLPSSYS